MAEKVPDTVSVPFRLFKCGACGSGICAEEKFKKLKTGKVLRYVYYHCTKGADRNCKEKTIREEELIKQLIHIADKVDIDEISAREKIQQEINKYKKFSYAVLGQTTEFDKKPTELDVRNYIKYILANGSKDEKREVLECLKSKLEIKNKMVCLRIGAGKNQ